MEMIGKIRRMYFRDHLSLHEITKRTGMARNTVRTWIRKPTAKAPPQYTRQRQPGKLTPFHATLEQALKADSFRAKHNRRTAKGLFEQIQAEGYAGGYSAVTDFVRAWRGKAGKTPQGFVPLQFALGEAFQFDWSEEHLLIGGVYRKVLAAHTKLCASRAFWVVAYPSQGHEMLFDAHARSFAALGGVPRRGIYDNMKTAVDKVLKGKGRIVNARFSVMCAHYLFDPDFCNVASGWEKGVVEKNVQDSRRRIWLAAQSVQFSSFDALNVWLAERCRALWAELKHPEFKALSIAEMLEQERLEMMPMPTPFDGYVEHLASVSSTCLITVASNRYSVPCEWSRHRVSVRLYPSQVVIVVDDAIVARHERLLAEHQVSFDWQHYVPLISRKPGALRNGAPFAEMPTALLRLKQGLLRRNGGDKVMAQVLATVPIAGLDAVLVAVELVLESGVLSIEHILNVVARLTEPPATASAETQLKLGEEPQANTERYDQLRATSEATKPTTQNEESNHA
ncbi:IS21 family transposase [uncultured Deefgea sp.]|uniref:IS21 family transposase n=1 Tax=uncultured Deefgea sp. TaxID=1304914 RepID=UPI00260DF2C4|nr:IS21 family transposase [uncultured Deefgea sp.]